MTFLVFFDARYLNGHSTLSLILNVLVKLLSTFFSFASPEIVVVICFYLVRFSDFLLLLRRRSWANKHELFEKAEIAAFEVAEIAAFEIAEIEDFEPSKIIEFDKVANGSRTELGLGLALAEIKE